MNPNQLWGLVTAQLMQLADRAADELARQLPSVMDKEPAAAGTILEGRLLTAVNRLPPTDNSLVELVREIAGDLGSGSPVRLHGWQRPDGAPRGVALVAADATGLAVLGLTPGRLIDVVVTPGTSLEVRRDISPWKAAVAVAADAPGGWDTEFGPGLPPTTPGGTATITLTRTGRLQAGMSEGPGLRVDGVGIRITATPDAPPAVAIELRELVAAILPAALARLVGTGGSAPMAGTPTTVTAGADRVRGLRFVGTNTVRVELPLRVDGAGVRTRGAALELTGDSTGLRVGLSVSVAASLPGLPVNVAIEGAGITLPLALSSAAKLGLDPDKLDQILPDGIGTTLAIPPVSGGGLVRRSGRGFGGLISVDLGVIALEATALFQPPDGAAPTSLLVLMAARFQPGIQLGFGFALDAVGGLVGVNRRVDVSALQRLAMEGNTDHVLFPDRVAERAGEIIGSLSSAFPVQRGRLLVGPMVRISWGAQMVSLSGALVLELPAPVRAVLVGRLLVAMPTPEAPLIRLQAGVIGRIDPGVPVVELLVSLAGSWIVRLPVRGEIYLLVRGGQEPEFVLSAGGFHPRYTRPAGVPALRRLMLDLSPGGLYSLRMEAYFAVTSNAVMFGGQVLLEAMIARCGVEGWIGLDALFIFEPTFAFAVHARAGVAVRAFGRRLLSVGLDFTLEGPAPWHAFGTGSVSVLFWDIALDFDIRWGAPPQIAQVGGVDPQGSLVAAVARSTAWVAQRPAAERTGLSFTADATKRLAAGSLVHPDSTFRVGQSVVPLGVPITRFQHRPIPVQTWTIRGVTFGRSVPPESLRSVPERFVLGEYFDLSEEAKLTGPAFASHAGGVTAGTDGARLGAGHRVDDGYETAYEPPLTPPESTRWPGLFDHESVVTISAAERLGRWSTTTPLVRLRQPTRSVAATKDLRPIVEDLTLVDALADPWQAVREQLGPDVQLVESWELSR